MRLLIDTTEPGRLKFEVNNQRLDKLVNGLSENLLPQLKRFLKTHQVKLRDLKKIVVNPGPGGFSSTRTGVVAANALAYALGIPKQNVLPRYDKAPNITKPKK